MLRIAYYADLDASLRRVAQLATPLVRLVALPHLTVPLNCPRLLPNASSQYHVLVWVFWVT